MVRLLIRFGLFFVSGLLLAAPALATFPGQNGKIAFSGNAGVYTINPDGSDEQLVARNASGAVWSPDGRRLAVLTVDTVPPFESCGIAVMNSDGSYVTKIPDARTGCGVPVAWSPDGTKIAFTGFRGVAVVNADGSDLRDVTPPELGAVWPTWSPDGKKLAFADRGEDIWTIDVDGTGQRNLTNTVSDFEDSPAWSPNGVKIAFRSAPHSEGTVRYDIYTINADGTGRTRLTTESHYTYGFVWSPVDGTQLAFTHWQPGSDEYPFGPYFGVVRAGDAPRRLALGVFPVWSPDGQKLAFPLATSYRSSSLATISPDGSGLTELVDGGFPTDWQPIPFKNRSKRCKAERKTGRDLGKCVSGRGD